MENIYKIKIRSNPDPRDLYPSERRYSSSIVLGFSVMFLALAMTSSLMGTLVVRRLATNATHHNEIKDNFTDSYNSSAEVDRFVKKVEKDLIFHEGHHYLNKPATISAGAFVMSLGLLLAGITGIFAWKQWYIDNNITWFFLASCFSTITSSISLLLVALTLMEYCEDYLNDVPQISLGLMANILVTSLLGVVWSAVATKVSFRGMNSDYPDDIVISKARGRIEVNTVRKGNKIAKVIPPDILNHFPTSGKLAKYFPRKDDGNLPKEESNKEYEERVKKFLSGQQEDFDGK